LGEVGHRITVHRIDVVERGDGADPGVPGRRVHLRHAGVTRQRTGQGVLAAAGTDDKGPHEQRC
jgi:hypothetical protein